jgi:hypothetical protein
LGQVRGVGSARRAADAGRGVGARLEDERPLSPELALIDPDLARVAREQQTRAPADAALVAGTHARTSSHSESPSRPRRRRRRFVWAAALITAIAAGVLFLPSDKLLRTAHLRGTSHGRQAQPETPTNMGSSRTGSKRATSASAAALGRASQASFGWVPVRNASYYVVRFFRGDRRVFEARPAQPRLVLPLRWRFGGRRYRLEPGRYHWSVRPGFGRRSAERLGKPIVDADWVAGSTPSR